MHDDDRESAPPPREAPEKVARAQAFCQELLGRMGAAVEVSVRETPEAIGVSLAPRDGNGVEISSALVEAVQYLVNRVVNPRAEGRKWVNLEVGGFPDGADPATQAMALRLAETAKRTGKVLALAPISPRDRRAIHLALVDVEGVSTRREGAGIFRQLLVVPGPKPRTPPSGS
jgi:spoIIIJ-associated protein